MVGFEQYTRPLENLWGLSAKGRKCGCEWASRTTEHGAWDKKSTNITITRTHARARSRSREVMASFVFNPHDEMSRVAFRDVRRFAVVSPFFVFFLQDGERRHTTFSASKAATDCNKKKLHIEGDSGLALC